MSISLSTEQLETNLKSALSLISTSGFTKETINQAIDVYKKTRLVRLLSDKRFIAIAGAQGAGKTTLISLVYQLDGWLDGNVGRGEKLPVFISEQEGLKEPQAYKTIINDQGEEERKTCDNQEFNKILYNGNDDNLLLLEIKVPQKLGMNEQTAWVLLPGYETENRENRAWQRLMRYVVQYASAKVVVVDEQRMAKSQDKMLSDLKKNIIGESLPLIAITRTEGIRSQPEKLAENEKLAELITRAKDLFEVGEEQIVCTGTDPENWLEEFESKTIATLISQSSISQSHLDSLVELIDDDVQKIIEEIEEYIHNNEAGNSIQYTLIEHILKSFYDEVRKYRNEYDKNLKNSLNPIATEAIDRAKGKYKEEDEGFLNNAGILVKRLTFRGSDVDDRRKERIDQEWKPELITQANIKAIAETNQEKIGLERVDYLRLESIKEEQSKELKIKENNITGLRILLRGSEMPISIGDNALKRVIEDSIKLLPTLAMEHYRLFQESEQCRASISVPQPKRQDILTAYEVNVLKNFPENFKNIEKNSKSIQSQIIPLLKTLGLVAGADIAADGKMDGNFSITSDGLGTSITGALLIGAAINTLYQISNNIYYIDRKNKEAIGHYLNSYAENTRLALLNNFDSSMEKIADLIRESLEKLYDAGGEQTQNHQLMITLKHLKNAKANARNYLTSDIIQRA